MHHLPHQQEQADSSNKKLLPAEEWD